MPQYLCVEQDTFNLNLVGVRISDRVSEYKYDVVLYQMRNRTDLMSTTLLPLYNYLLRVDVQQKTIRQLFSRFRADLASVAFFSELADAVYFLLHELKM